MSGPTIDHHTGFNLTSLRNPNPRRKRPCRDCGREYEATLRLPRCGDCHDRRLRDIQEARTSLSQGHAIMSLPVEEDDRP